MKYKIAAITEGLILSILVLVIIFSGLRALSNWTAGTAASRGLDLVQFGQYEAAKKKFEDAVAARPDYIPGLQALLHLSLYSDPPDEKVAKDTADKLLSLTGGKGQEAAAAHMALGALKVQKAEKERDAEKRIALLKAADSEFRKANAADPDCAETFVNRGILAYVLYLQTEAKPDLAAAVKFLTMARSRPSISIHALYPLAATYGQLLYAQGRQRTALDELRKAMELDPTQGEGLTNLAIAYAYRLSSEAVTLEEKRAMLQVVEGLLPEDNPAYFLFQSAIGSAYFDLDRYGDVRSLFMRLASKFPEEGSAIANVAAAEYARLKRAVNPKPEGPIANAVDALTSALDEKKKISPRNKAKCLNLLALCIREGYPFRRTKNPKRLFSAEYYLREAVRLDPSFWAAARNLGVMHQQKNEWRDALKYYKLSLPARKTQVDLDRAIKKFETPPQIMSPPTYSSAMTVIPGQRGISMDKFPAMLIGVQPSYPGKIEKDATKISIDGAPQPYWEFITNNDIAIVSKDPLEDGLHKLEAKLVDAGGNQRSFLWPFVVDLEDPTIVYRSPEPGATVHSATVFTVEMEDSSGIDLKSVEVTVGRAGGASMRIIGEGAYQYDMMEIKKFRKAKLEASRFQFTLPKGFLTGSIRIGVKFNDNSGRSYDGEEWQLKLVKSE